MTKEFLWNFLSENGYFNNLSSFPTKENLTNTFKTTLQDTYLTNHNPNVSDNIINLNKHFLKEMITKLNSIQQETPHTNEGIRKLRIENTQMKYNEKIEQYKSDFTVQKPQDINFKDSNEDFDFSIRENKNTLEEREKELQKIISENKHNEKDVKNWIENGNNIPEEEPKKIKIENETTQIDNTVLNLQTSTKQETTSTPFSKLLKQKQVQFKDAETISPPGRERKKVLKAIGENQLREKFTNEKDEMISHFIENFDTIDKNDISKQLLLTIRDIKTELREIKNIQKSILGKIN